MPKRQAEGCVIQDDFGYQKHPELKTWIEKEFPKLEAEATMTRFVEYAQDSGRIATVWTACFKRVVRTGIDNGWKGICVFKNGKHDDPQWQSILALAKQYGFRAPAPDEPTPGLYRTAFERWKANEKRSDRVLPFENPLKRLA